MVKQNLAGGPRQGGQVNFLFRVVATVGFVNTYTSRSESHCVALYFKYTFCVELWLSLHAGTYRGTATRLAILQYSTLYLIRYFEVYIFFFVFVHNTQYTWKSTPGIR